MKSKSDPKNRYPSPWSMSEISKIPTPCIKYKNMHHETNKRSTQKRLILYQLI